MRWATTTSAEVWFGDKRRGRQFTDIGAARFVIAFLFRSGRKVGVDPEGMDCDEFVRHHRRRAGRGLPVDEYRLVWRIASALR
jgi:hypothetical protein